MSGIVKLKHLTYCYIVVNPIFFKGRDDFCADYLWWLVFNPIALRKAKIAYNFGLSGCNRVKLNTCVVLLKGGK